MKCTVLLNALVAGFLANHSCAFTPYSTKTSSFRATTSQVRANVNRSKFLQDQRSTTSRLLVKAQPGEEEKSFFSDLTINPLFATLWIGFNFAAFYLSSTEPSGASQTLIEGFMADPLHPGFGSALFESVWNLVGTVAVPLACVIMPGAKDQKLNPTPFLFASLFAGYGILGPFMMTRTPRNSVTQNDLGWFTKNILENKIFNWIVFVALANAYVISGAAEAFVTNPGATFEEFTTMISGSALGTASTLDFTILCLTGASLVPEDLRRRGVDADDGKAYGIAASTLLLPGAGLALYSALRPSLAEE
mmetsp:Transcript_30593/g.46331  ORF Transcript_30593/g.46331 Transcript_30593/m.46331 type:complete len:306 (-) Transcript_30593:130-1047(-)